MSKEKSLTAADLLPKERVRVVKVNATTSLRKKFLSMGLLPGVIIEMVRPAPLGDPIAIKVKGYDLSLRKSEARNITVEKIK